MVKKEKDGLHLYSEDGSKHLGGPYPNTKEGRRALARRIRQVEYYKKQEAKRK